MINQKTNTTGGYWLYINRVLVILLVVGLGVFAVNQVLDYRYKVVFLKTPCALCADLNPEVKECLTQRVATYWSNNELVDNAGNCWNLNGEKIECKNKINITRINFSLP